MRVITYGQMAAFITAAWIIVRLLAAVRRGKLYLRREARLLLVYVCLIVVARFVYFPLRRVNGRIGTLTFDPSQILPLQMNLVPLVRLAEVYDGWQVNIIGNVAMFIPVGIVWPYCFKKLNTVGKTVLAGAFFSLCIEISQLFLFERSSDVDDLILNTLGMAIGALIFFSLRKRAKKRPEGLPPDGNTAYPLFRSSRRRLRR